MYKTLWLMVIKVGDKWCKATTTWKFWWNFLAKSLFFSRYPSFSPFECPDAYKCYTFSESYGSRETREIKISTSKFDLEAQGILSPLWTQTGPWSDTASYVAQRCNRIHPVCAPSAASPTSGVANLVEFFISECWLFCAASLAHSQSQCCGGVDN